MLSVLVGYAGTHMHMHMDSMHGHLCWSRWSMGVQSSGVPFVLRCADVESTSGPLRGGLLGYGVCVCAFVCVCVCAARSSQRQVQAADSGGSEGGLSAISSAIRERDQLAPGAA